MLTKTLTAFLAVSAAVHAAPHFKRQAVTELISSGTAPAGCKTVSTSLFGIGIHKATDVPKTLARRQATQATDGQPSVPTVTNIVSVISDGQPQAPTSTMTMMPISQIHDGQAQAYYSPVSQIGDGQVQAPTGTAVSQIGDGQVQAPTGTPISQIGDGQPQAPTATATPATQKSDGQPNVPTGTGVTQATDGQPAATNAPTAHMVACKTNSTLELTIENGVLYDGLRRQGYIASNYQFQFDAGAPQAGAIITSGFSLCSDGTLALGGSKVFWQCLSGSFYNLYDRDWAAQCEPVYLTALELINCPA